MANFVSPGNYVIIQSTDGYISALNSRAVGVVGFASRGPVDTPTLVTNQESLIQTFGTPDRAEGGQGLIAAYELLENTNSVWFTRAAAPSKATSVAAVRVGAQPFVAVSSLAQTKGYSFFINVRKADGTLANSSPYVVGVPSGTDVIADINDTIASYLPEDADFSFIKVSSSLGYFVGNYAGSAANLEIKGVNTSTNGGVFSALGTTGRAAGGGGKPLEGPNGVITVPDIAVITAQAASWPDADSHAMFGTPGVHYTDLIESAAWLAGSGTHAQYQGSAVSSYGNTADWWVSLESLYEGSGYNYETSTTPKGLKAYGMRSVLSSKKGKDSLINFSMDGAIEESYSIDFINATDKSTNWVLDELNVDSAANTPTSRFYIAKEGVVDASNRFVSSSGYTAPATYSGTFVATAHNTSAAVGTSGTATMKFAKLLDGTYNFSGGVNGDVADEGGSMSDADITTALIGSTASRTGMQGFLDDTIDISYLLVPGVHVESVQNAAVSLASTQERFRYLTSPPEGLPSAQRAINWHNGLGDGRSTAINHYLTSIQWPWTEFFDIFAGTKDYLDPAVEKAKILVSMDDRWQAGAGLNRGKIPKATDVEVTLTQGDRDALYGGGNVINPIAKFPQEGVVMWGIRTSQRESNSLDKENVADLLLVIKKQLLRSTRDFAFEPNDPITWSRIIGRLNPYLADIKERRGLVGYSVICDKTTNTKARQDRGEIWCKVVAEPVKIGEKVIFELNVTSESGSISIA